MGSVAGKNIDQNHTTGTKNKRSTKVGNLYRRHAYHAGSWYDNEKDTLNQTLQKYLDNAESDLKSKRNNDSNENNNDLTITTSSSSSSSFRAVIVPHAGYRFSGPTAAYSYYTLQQALLKANKERNKIRHILVLHPAHHIYLNGCAVSGASYLETPLGNLHVDNELRNEILNLSSKHDDFQIMKQHEDEEEHSGEMQYPYLAKILFSQENHNQQTNNNIPSVLPIMCGALSNEQEQYYGQLLAPIIARSDVICVISSDFCHWGSRFRYQPTPSKKNSNNNNTNNIPIHEYIQQLDQQGMDLITMQEPGAFATYLKQTKNTICGRHAISVYLHAIHYLQTHHQGQNGFSNNPKYQIEFIKYAQSSAVQHMTDSSVSYASAVVTATQ